mgnify:CR=1 FL=1
MSENKSTTNKGFIRFIEKGGNALPHPAILFAIFALITLIISAIGGILGWNGIHPATGETVNVINLLSKEGVHRVLLEWFQVIPALHLLALLWWLYWVLVLLRVADLLVLQ